MTCEIRIRAERRLGEMLAATKASGRLNQAATLKRGPVVATDDHGKAVRSSPTTAPNWHRHRQSSMRMASGSRVGDPNSGISKRCKRRAMTWTPGTPVRTEQDRAEWKLWRRDRTLMLQRERRARCRRVDYYPASDVARVIDALLAPGSNHNFSSAIDHIVREWVDLRKFRK